MKRSMLAAVCSTSLAVALMPGLTTSAFAALAEGAPDTSFSGDGAVITSIADQATAQAVARQSDGKIVVAGNVTTGGVGRALFARYTRAGTLDTTFSGDGIATPTISAASDSGLIRDVALQPDGKIVGFGTGFSGGGGSVQKFLVVRLNPNGSLDTTFNGTGWRATSLNTTIHGDTGWGLVLQPDGKIVGTGQSRAGNGFGDPDYVGVVRYLANGKLDPTFSGDGIATVPIGADAWGNKIALQSDGRIVIAGGTFPTSGSDPDQMLVVRLKPNGALDTTFNGTGHWISTYGAGERDPYDLVVQPDGRIVIGGQNEDASDYDAVLVRFRTNGSLDPTFGSAGIATANFSPSDWISSLALQPDGRIVAGGSVLAGGHNQAAVMRFNRDGSVDASFAGGRPYLTSANNDSFIGIAVAPDGRISAAGFTQDATTTSILAARFVGDATAPYGAHLIGVPRWSTATSRTLAWTAADDNTGVRSFDVRVRSAAYNRSTYGSYQSFRQGTQLPYGTFKGTPGRTYCFSVRARDVAGNVGVYGAESCVAFPVDDRTASASAGWAKLTGSHFYRHTARSSTARGSTLKLPVRYRHLAILVTKCSGCGTVKVFLGSHALATVKLGASHTRNQVLVPIESSLTVRAGTLVIKQVSGGHRTVIDGIAVSLA
jgi:uncharacterized delta-60 repeat protein